MPKTRPFFQVERRRVAAVLGDMLGDCESSASPTVHNLYRRRPFKKSMRTQTCLLHKFENNDSCGWISDGVNELSQNFKELFQSQQQCDIILNVNGREFKAHKIILITRSPVFSKMFCSNMVEQSSGFVQINDCDPKIFHLFLLYLYSGKVEELNMSNVTELYCVADKYEIKSLIVICVKFMLNNFSIESFCIIVLIALRHSESELLETAKTFLAAHLLEIITSDNWKAFNAENPAEANELVVKALGKGRFTVF